MDRPDIFFLGIIPDLTFRVEVSRRAEINEIACSADVDQLSLRAIRFCFLAGNDGCYKVACERVAGIDGDVMFFA